MAGFQAPITIHQAIDRIRKNEYLLPAFQREFVWSSDQIEKLFDSLMKGYPISSMLFWKVKGETKTDFRFYQFLKQFIQYNRTHNDSISTDHVNDFYSILDGQQRLTALFIGLCGSYAYKEYRRAFAYSEWSYPTRHLYLNISKTYTEEESDRKFIFSFLNKADSKEKDLFIDNESNKWFRIGRILSLHQDEEYDLYDFAEEYKLSKESKKILKRLDKVIHTDLIINYYEEDDQKPDKAVNIFVRINSGGTYLSFSDILMSIAVANWKEKDARNEIYTLVDNIGCKGFNISKDYVLKAFLFLYHKDVRSMITSFNNGFIVKIEENWEKIRNSILSLFDLAKSFGLTDYTLTSYNATLPILYYLYHKDIYEDFATKKCYETERESIRRWLFSILLRKTFGGQGDAVLTQARRAFTNDIETKLIKPLNDFPVKEINTEIKKITDVGDDFIEELLLTQKDSRYSFPILAMLYPDMDYKNNNFHQDHLHPASTYDQLKQEHKDKFGWTVYNSILNLQMLDSNVNMSKNATPLGTWIIEQTKNKDKDRFIESHLIPNVDYSLDNFDNFIVERKKILIEKLKNILN
ncbi:MAG: DUF262 domain-containing protein [Bacteroidaceae bacterium]|nr:DUF262 domain-containing protein [Bacteroidaceae bacterium]